MQEVQPRKASCLSSPEPSIAPTIVAQPTEESILTAEQIARRRLLQGTSAVAATAALASLLAPTAITAQPATPATVPAMRTPQRDLTAAAAGLPDLPALGIMALNRMGFGPRPGDLDAFNALGNSPAAALEAYVEQQLNPAAIDDSACDAILASYQFQTLNKSLAQLWADHIKAPMISYDTRIAPVRETEKATFVKAVYSKRQLQEVLADFWFNHFNIQGWDSWAAPVFVHYDRDVIRANMLGNFRQMLGTVAQSPAMLYYLDNQSNSGGNPNENYARELFELHTMGSENYLGVVPLTVNQNGSFDHPGPKDANGRPLLYVDDDVYGATTCFTGWRVNTDTGIFTFDSSAHFPYQKLVLGQAIPAAQGVKDGNDVLDLLARHAGTAHFICRKLCRRLISDNPPESVIQAAAAVFMAQMDAPDQLKQVTRTILLSDEFRTTWGEKIKRPFEYVVSLLRAAQADFTPDDTFLWLTGIMGQRLYSWQPPNGYPDFKTTWSSTMPMLQRWRICNWLLNSWTYGGTEANKDELRIQFTNPPTIKKPTAIIDAWSLSLLGRLLPDNERQPIVNFMAGAHNPDFDLPDDEITERLPFAIGLIFMSPSFQWR